MEELARYVADEAQRCDVPRDRVRFTQRQLRESLCWSDRSLRRQLARLVQLEYVLAYRTGRGNGREYQLLYDPTPNSAEAVENAWQLGLCPVEKLKNSTQPRQPHT